MNDTVKSNKPSPLSPLKGAFKVVQTLERVPSDQREGALRAAAVELGIKF